jgi:hypothetical protein
MKLSSFGQSGSGVPSNRGQVGGQAGRTGPMQFSSGGMQPSMDMGGGVTPSTGGMFGGGAPRGIPSGGRQRFQGGPSQGKPQMPFQQQPMFPNTWNQNPQATREVQQNPGMFNGMFDTGSFNPQLGQPEQLQPGHEWYQPGMPPSRPGYAQAQVMPGRRQRPIGGGPDYQRPIQGFMDPDWWKKGGIKGPNGEVIIPAGGSTHRDSSGKLIENNSAESEKLEKANRRKGTPIPQDMFPSDWRDRMRF